VTEPCPWLLPSVAADQAADNASADDDIPSSTPTFDELTSAADRYLRNLGCSLYGRSWGLWDSGWDEAVGWLAGEVANVLAEAASPSHRVAGGQRDE
jgi:hypothetical protein